MNKIVEDKVLGYTYDSFCFDIMKKVRTHVGVVKFQSAYFESVGPDGMIALKHIIQDAKRFGFYTILDAKRSDISTTAEAYAKAAFDIYDADALTILPFMGEQSIRVFVDYARKRDRQLFVVVYPTEESIYSGYALKTLRRIQEIGDENLNNGYGDVGAVISGVAPNFIGIYRQIVPRVFFLVPGMGTQGGKVEDQLGAFQDGNGAILNYSRNVIYAVDPLAVIKTIQEQVASMIQARGREVP
jgi:orotidine-5'-phosphate decarboxylase